jgi:glycosyltransferase involved in cell wall biosynthesis
LPVVAFDVGGVNEWLVDGYNGFLVPWMDRRAFAQRLEKLLRDKPLARRLGERGLELVSTRFDFSSYISNLERIFRRLQWQTGRGVAQDAPVALSEAVGSEGLQSVSTV